MFQNVAANLKSASAFRVGETLNQKTIAEKVACTGVGLHTGEAVQMVLHPARPDSGIVFVRTDFPYPVEIPVRPDSISSTRLATTLGKGDATVSTVEHVLAALYALGIDNVRIEMDGPEVPVMDGSSAPFVHLLRAAGTFEQDCSRRVLKIRRPIEVRDGEKRIRLLPSRSFKVSYAVDFAHPLIGRQEIREWKIDAAHFEEEIAHARTFGFLHEVEALWKAGLARGGSFENTVVLDSHAVINREGLRWEDEFVRHKVLDLIGDLAVLGMPLQGHVCVERGGHAMHQKLIVAILENPSAWQIIEPATGDFLGLDVIPFGALVRATA